MKMPNIPQEQIQEIAQEMARQEQSAKQKFVKALAKEIVAQMFEASENKSKEKNYIG